MCVCVCVCVCVCDGGSGRTRSGENVDSDARTNAVRPTGCQRLGPVLFDLVPRVWTSAYIMQGLRGRPAVQFLFFFWCSISELMKSSCCFTSTLHILKKFFF